MPRATTDSPGHHPRRPHERAAWSGTLRRLLPDPPARVLDAGAGTGFLSLLLAAQGYQVTAMDLSPGMLEMLRAKAARQGLEVEIVVADAVSPPGGPFDAVVERHLLWTLPDPGAALAAWRQAVPTGRLVLIEGTWGKTTGTPRCKPRPGGWSGDPWRRARPPRPLHRPGGQRPAARERHHPGRDGLSGPGQPVGPGQARAAARRGMGRPRRPQPARSAPRDQPPLGGDRGS